MNLSAPFIKRSVATTLLAIGLAIAGIVAFRVLPVSSLPQVEFPVIMVQAMLPGASPEVMASSVATPLERQFGRIAGITQMTSTSNLGSTTVIIMFDLSRNIDGAARDVQAAINAARSQLPSNLPNNPTYRKVNPADAPILIFALTSDTYTKGQMYDAASTVLQQKFSQIEGVGQVIVGGSSLPAVRAELNPNALNNYGIGLEAVHNAISAANVNRPKGQLSNNTTTSQIVANDQLFGADQYKSLILAYRNNAPVRLGDVANVTNSIENVRSIGLSKGKPAVLLVIFKQPNANVVETANRIYRLLPQLKASIPAGIHMDIVMDRTPMIRASLHDVELTLIVAILLVILVVYIFLGDVRTALIPTVAVPLSLLGTFAVMYLLGYSLNILSLMALTISTGFVVDDAVVVLENTMRHIEAGMDRMQATLLGAQEVGFTVMSMSISLVAVFTPILLMGGIVGRLFREFAVTLSVAIVMSLLVSLTVTPMMCARVLRSRRGRQNDKSRDTATIPPHPPLQKRGTNQAIAPLHELTSPNLPPCGERSEGGEGDPRINSAGLFQRMHRGYEHSLSWALNHSRLMLIITLGAIVLNLFLFVKVPKGFFPQQDTGRIVASVQAQQDISFQAMQQKIAALVKIVAADPAVANVVGFTGAGTNTTNSGTVFITLKPKAQRKVSSDTVINRLRPKLAVVPGATLYMQVAQDIVIGGRQSNAQFQYTVTASTLAELNQWMPKIITTISKLPGIVDVNNDQLNHGLQAFVTYDYDTAARFGITADQIGKTLYDAFGQSQISVMYTLLNQYHVVMEFAPEYLQRPETLNNVYVTSSTGKQVPLSAFASYASSSTLLSVNHQNQFPAATISFNLSPHAPLGNAVSEVENAVKTLHLPPGVIASFQGTAQAFKASLAGQPLLILAALLAVYIVLGILYESLIHPITILSTLPSAGCGALLALIVTRTDLSIIALIGIILLIGIVKKNAIMMIDFALHAKRTQRKSSQQAIYEAAVLRFRPIMMTTFAAIGGALPLVIAHGEGAEMRQPLGIAVIGGLIVSQLLTLYTTPVVFLAMERVSIRFKRWRKPQQIPDPASS